MGKKVTEGKYSSQYVMSRSSALKETYIVDVPKGRVFFSLS